MAEGGFARQLIGMSIVALLGMRVVDVDTSKLIRSAMSLGEKVDPVVLIVKVSISADPASRVLPVDKTIAVVIDAIPADLSSEGNIDIDKNRCIALALVGKFASAIKALAWAVGDNALVVLVGQGTHASPAWRAPEVAMPVGVV